MHEIYTVTIIYYKHKLNQTASVIVENGRTLNQALQKAKLLMGTIDDIHSVEVCEMISGSSYCLLPGKFLDMIK